MGMDEQSDLDPDSRNASRNIDCILDRAWRSTCALIGLSV